MLRIVIGYFWYRLFASHRKGFGIHSPFVFDLVTNVLMKNDDDGLTRIKTWRKKLLFSNEKIKTIDAGAGSKVHNSYHRRVKKIIRKSSISHKYGRFLYYLTGKFKPQTIIELGTGLGISTAYFMKANPGAKIIGVDADKSKLDYAEKALRLLETTQPEFSNGSFDEFLLSKLKNVEHPLLIFIDGDHNCESLIRYFNQILNYIKADSIIVIDDIRWSGGMKRAWNLIRNDGRTILCIDLFFMGIIFFREGMIKQNYIVNL